MTTLKVIIALICLLDLMMTAHLHGQPKDQKYNVFATMFSWGLLLWIFYSTGLFN